MYILTWLYPCFSLSWFTNPLPLIPYCYPHDSVLLLCTRLSGKSDGYGAWEGADDSWELLSDGNWTPTCCSLGSLWWIGSREGSGGGRENLAASVMYSTGVHFIHKTPEHAQPKSEQHGPQLWRWRQNEAVSAANYSVTMRTRHYSGINGINNYFIPLKPRPTFDTAIIRHWIKLLSLCQFVHLTKVTVDSKNMVLCFS